MRSDEGEVYRCRRTGMLLTLHAMCAVTQPGGISSPLFSLLYDEEVKLIVNLSGNPDLDRSIGVHLYQNYQLKELANLKVLDLRDQKLTGALVYAVLV